MNITILAEYFLPRLGGVEVFAGDLGQTLHARGHDVRVVTTTPEDPSAQGARIPTLAGADPVGIEVVRVPSWQVPGMGVPLSPRLPGRFLDALAAAPTDVVHVHASIASAGALAGGWAAHRLGFPIVVTFHSILGGHSWVHRLAHRLTGWGAWPHVVAGVSTHVARDVEGVLERPAIVLRNGVDTAWWGEIEKRPRASVLGRVRLVAVQRLKSRKRGSALLDIVAAAQERLPASNGLELTFVGDGPRRDALERKAKELALQVRFLGACSREATRDALLDADCFIMASDRESFGLAAAEARAVGLPVLAYRSGSLPELVEDGVAGLLSDSDDEMVRSLVRLASEDGLIERLATESARTPPPCDWTSVIAEHERAYRDAIERSGNGTPARRAQGG